MPLPFTRRAALVPLVALLAACASAPEPGPATRPGEASTADVGSREDGTLVLTQPPRVTIQGSGTTVASLLPTLAAYCDLDLLVVGPLPDRVIRPYLIDVLVEEALRWISEAGGVTIFREPGGSRVIAFAEVVRGRLVGWDDASVTLAVGSRTTVDLTLPAGTAGAPMRAALRTACEGERVALRCRPVDGRLEARGVVGGR